MLSVSPLYESPNTMQESDSNVVSEDSMWCENHILESTHSREIWIVARPKFRSSEGSNVWIMGALYDLIKWRIQSNIDFNEIRYRVHNNHERTQLYWMQNLMGKSCMNVFLFVQSIFWLSHIHHRNILKRFNQIMNWALDILVHWRDTFGGCQRDSRPGEVEGQRLSAAMQSEIVLSLMGRRDKLKIHSEGPFPSSTYLLKPAKNVKIYWGSSLGHRDGKIGSICRDFTSFTRLGFTWIRLSPLREKPEWFSCRALLQELPQVCLFQQCTQWIFMHLWTQIMQVTKCGIPTQIFSSTMAT